MIVRIVKMDFKPEHVRQFTNLFSSVREKIAATDGCESLLLYRDTADKNRFFTYSHWRSEADLNRYRESPLFKDTWAKTKVLFRERPAAWSVEEISNP